MNSQILKKTVLLFSSAVLLVGYDLNAAPGATGVGAGAGAGIRTGGAAVVPNTPTPTSPNLTPPGNPNVTSPNNPNLTPPSSPNLTPPGNPNLTPPGNPNLTPPGNPNLTPPSDANLTPPGNPNAIPTNAVPNSRGTVINGVIYPDGVVPGRPTNGINGGFVNGQTNGFRRRDWGTNRVPPPGTNGFFRNPGTNQAPPGVAAGVDANGNVTVPNP